MIIDATKTIVSSLTTYSSWEMAVAAAPAARRAVPVLVIRLGDDGNFSTSSEARSEGGGFVAIDRLHYTVSVQFNLVNERLLTSLSSGAEPRVPEGKHGVELSIPSSSVVHTRERQHSGH